MIKKLAVLVVASVLLTGCGGGSSEPEKAATSAPPKVYTGEQLQAAMPKLADFPKGATKGFECPHDKDSCGPSDGSVSYSILVGIEPVNTVAQEQALAANPATPVDGAAVNVQLHNTDAEADAAHARFRKSNAAYEGDYDIPAEKTDRGTIPGSKGTGSIRPLTIGAWKGFVVERTVVSPKGSSSEPIQLIAQTYLVKGRASAGSFASLSAGGRDAAAAKELADSLIREYLERLG